MQDRPVILLDIDGVLNEPQQPITLCMQHKLQQLARHKQIYFVTGNTYVKAVDILAGPISMYAGVFCNNADELRSMRGKLMWRDEVTEALPMDVGQFLIAQCQGRKVRNSCIEWRSPRFVNFCPIGRYSSKEERDGHDGSWRKSFLNSSALPNCEVSIGGQVSIDIYSKGADKSRAAKWVNDQGKNFIFIGDKTDIAGNDYPVKKYCDEHTKNTCLTSTGPIHTMELIDNILR